MDKLDSKLLKKALNKISVYERRKTSALGLEYLEVRGDKLVRVFPDGSIKEIGKPAFGERKNTTKKLKINSEG